MRMPLPIDPDSASLVRALSKWIRPRPDTADFHVLRCRCKSIYYLLFTSHCRDAEHIVGVVVLASAMWA